MARPLELRAEEARPWLLGGPRAPFEESLVSERPSFSSSPDATPAGRVNAELGFELGRDERGGPRRESAIAPAALIRLGLVDRFEARLGWSGYEVSRADGSERDSVAGPMLGFKGQLTQGSDRRPRVGFLFEVELATDGRAEPDATAALAWRQVLRGPLSLFGTSTLGSVEGDRFESTHAGGLSWGFASAWSVYLEYYATIDEDALDTHSLDAGLAYLLTPNVQLDVYGGAGLDDGARDGFVGAGIAWRM